MQKIMLIGGGGHCRAVIDTLKLNNEYEIIGIFDKAENIGGDIYGVPFVAEDSDVSRYYDSGIKLCFICVGSVGDPRKRIMLYENMKKAGFKMPNIMHPSAVVSPYVKFGEGNYVGPGAIINAGTSVGDNCIINTGAILDHDCLIGDNVHIATGAVLSGGVKVRENSHIGSGASVIQYAVIGDNTLIGSGSNVVCDIEPRVVAYGNPCKKARENVYA